LRRHKGCEKTAIGVGPGSYGVGAGMHCRNRKGIHTVVLSAQNADDGLARDVY
jgi:hypothetical protein